MYLNSCQPKKEILYIEINGVVKIILYKRMFFLKTDYRHSADELLYKNKKIIHKPKIPYMPYFKLTNLVAQELHNKTKQRHG
jgi:hypothetical protein